MALIKKFRIKYFKKDEPLVNLKKITLSFGKRQILDNVSFSINKGEILGMLGPNGVGKSTIFNIITGLIKPNYGSVFFGKEEATNYPIYLRTTKFKIGYVPQTGGAFSDLTVLENLKAISEILIKDKNEREFRINKLISKFELDAVKNIKVQYLSGGQKKRCVISLALLGNPQLLLLDEPFQALDILTSKMLQEVIVNLQTENPNMCILISDHAARDLLSVVDTAIVLSNMKIVSKGTPSQLINDPNAQTAYFGDSFKFN